MLWLASIALLGVLWAVFDARLEQAWNPNRNLTVQAGQSEMVLKRNRAGHYVAPGTINGRPVRFLLDTGATQVSVPAHLGPALNLVPGGPARVITANGEITVRATRIDALELGPFLVRDVAGHLNPGLGDNEVLLGMSVLRQLEFTQRGDTLILRPHSVVER